MNTKLVTINQARLPLVNGNKNTLHRVNKFQDWIQTTGQDLFSAPLEDYKSHLQESGYKLSSVNAHINSVKAAYRRLLKDRAMFYQSLPDDIVRLSIADQKAFVDEAITRIENSLDTVTVKTITKQDRLATDHIRLTKKQAETLINSPDLNTIQGLRDTAIIALMIATGLREQELCDLEVEDLRQKCDGGELCLYVRNGKGNKARLIPYGELSWVLILVDKWLETSGIETGPVFVSYFRGYSKIRGKLTSRAIQNILKDYPIVIDDKLATLKPHDLRRTYAKLYYETKKDIVRLSQNLGHSSIETTRGYVGNGDMKKRAPEQFVSFDLGKLTRNITR